MKVIIVSGLQVRLDDADADRLAGVYWYTKVAPNGLTYIFHRRCDGDTIPLTHFIMGAPPAGHVVNFIDGDPLNCQRANLRVVTRSVAGLSRRKQRTPTTSRFKGVSFDAQTGRWRARLHGHRDGRRWSRSLGYFASEDAAKAAYDAAVAPLVGAR